MRIHNPRPTWEDRSAIDVDRDFAKIYPLNGPRSATETPSEPYRLVGELAAPPTIVEAFAGVLLVAVEQGAFLLQRRDRLTTQNPGKTCIFGGKLRPSELPSGAAIRELAEETGICVGITQLLPLADYVEDRARVRTYRAVFVAMLDRVPSELRVGEGEGIEIVPITRAEKMESLTLLSREDIVIFLDYWYPGRAA
jgi:8-oxo-dGTP pyrophosphatase MutT (NUDIX family)